MERLETTKSMERAPACPVPLPPRREMERAARQRDSSYDGIFFLGVKTTGIFCRPSCPSRPARPENRVFFATPREALFAGFRPCRRCHPLEAGGAHPAWVRRLLGEIDRLRGERLPDAAVRRLGVDPARARRYFRSHFGMTFQAFCRARRLGEAFTSIREGADMTDIAYGTGYESTSGFRDAFAQLFGGAPGRARSEGDCVRLGWVESPIGPLLVGSTGAGVCLLEFTDRRALEAQLAIVKRRFDGALVPGKSRHLEQLEDELRRYFAGELREFEVPLVYPGTPFERAVWNELLRIPYGETRSYEAIADSIGRTGAQRAVGTANGRNRIAIVIPCHRVVNKSGELGGYGGGLWRKRFLLALERGERPLPLEGGLSGTDRSS